MGMSYLGPSLPRASCALDLVLSCELRSSPWPRENGCGTSMSFKAGRCCYCLMHCASPEPLWPRGSKVVPPQHHCPSYSLATRPSPVFPCLVTQLLGGQTVQDVMNPTVLAAKGNGALSQHKLEYGEVKQWAPLKGP